jgi:hypothetical protein
MNTPKWVRIAIAGAIVTLTLDYFLKPTINKTFNL